jgi:hypothetical protein
LISFQLNKRVLNSRRATPSGKKTVAPAASNSEDQVNSTDALCRIYHFEAIKQSRRRALAMLVIVAGLVTLATMGNGWKFAVGELTNSARVTVVHKNRIHPSLEELEARAVAADPGGANSDKKLVSQRQSQQI